MSDNTTWNDGSREDLRETLRNQILGEVRLAKFDRDEILQTCDEVYIQDDCPEDEQASFSRFAVETLEQAAAQHAMEQSDWPAETDCDRLDRAEAFLRNRGILLWQVSPCCDTCTRGELSDRVDEIDQKYPGFRKRMRGYAFFIDQNMAEMLAESSQISVYLGYGWVSPDDSDVNEEIYAKNAVAIAQEVCDCLDKHGLKTDWDGNLSRKIGVSLNWQRRTVLL